MRRRRGGRLIVVLVVAALGATAVATSAAAQEDEPGAVVTVNQIPNRLALSATGCSFAPGAPVRITFSGGGGASREFSRRVEDDTCFTWAPDHLDPCRLGASDLPGTKFTVGVEVPGAPYSLDQFVTLDPDTTKPRFLDPPFDASPRPGSKVGVGDEINLEVTATDKTPAPSWQTGVHSLQVTGPQGLLGSEDGGRLPKACGDKSKSLTVQGSHRVKRSDPAVIELCAVTEDYVPNENSKCAQWYKGEVWEGTVTQTWQNISCSSTATSPVQFAVKEGSGKFETMVAFTEVTSDCPAYADTWGSGVVTGRVTRNRMRIDGEGPLIPGTVARSGARIDGTYTNSLPGDPTQTYPTTWELQCVSCGDAPAG